MYSYGPPHMAKQKQEDHHEHTYSSYVRTQDVALKTCQRRWMIGRSGERGSGISVLARHDMMMMMMMNCLFHYIYILSLSHILTYTIYIYILGWKIFCNILATGEFAIGKSPDRTSPSRSKYSLWSVVSW